MKERGIVNTRKERVASAARGTCQGVCVTVLMLILTLVSGPAMAEEDDKMAELGAYIPYLDGFVNVRIEDYKFRVYFLDGEKEVIDLKFTKGVVAYEGIVKRDVEGRTGLSKSADGKYLVGARRIGVPFRYWVRLLLTDPDDPNKRQRFTRVKLNQ